MLDPVSLGVAGLQFGMSLMQQDAADKAKQQDYLNQTAFQDATTEFNQWQANFNAQTQNLNNQYAYWAETVNYNQQSIYAKQLSNYEFARELNQAETVFETRVGAGRNFVMQQEALQAQLQERGMQEAVAIQQYQYRALQASAAYQASGQEGKSMDRYVQNFARQAGDYKALAEINAGIRERQYTRDQIGAVTNYLSQYNSQDFYVKSPIQEPIAPFAPLPAMVTPPGPSMRGAPPSSNKALNIATAGLGAFNTYMATNAKVKELGWG